jgi:signal transduction histidine kinase
MEQRTFTIQQQTLVKALLYGHFVNILFGISIFGFCHLVSGLPVVQSVVLTVIGTLSMSIIVSWFGTRKLSEPIAALNKELDDLHEKVNTSTTALAKVNETTSAFVDSLPVGFLVFNSKTELTSGNQNAFTLLGYEAADMPETNHILERIKQLRSNGSDINFIDWLHEARSSKIQLVKRWPMVKISQGKSEVVCDVVAHYNKNDSHGNELVLLFIDRTDEYDRQEKQMEFISLAAHELRGPITIMRGLTDILQDEVGEKLSDEHKQLITRIIVSARQLSGYVDNILSVSRVDRDSFEVHPTEAQWSKVVAQAAQDLSIRAKAHHRSVEFTIPSDLPTVAVDSSSILHVINNLVDNAIKYSPDGGKVVVRAELKDDLIETTIQDFGMGIPANVVDNLFTKFYRSHRSKQIVNGTGLGLYLCKAIVEAHGGSIWVRSTEGSGTTFGFTLPTYSSVADQIKAGTSEEGIIRSSHGWIKNHALYRR